MNYGAAKTGDRCKVSSQPPIRQQITDLCREVIDQHQQSEDDELVLKSVIEDETVQQLIRQIMERHGETDYDRLDEAAEQEQDVQSLVEKLKERQRAILNDLDESSE
jgi:hypothetical protein